MKLLVIKLSSMGDAVHLLPALSDLRQQRPDVEVDWLVEPAFAEIAGWHPLVRQVIPLGLRALKQRFWAAPALLLALRRQLRNRNYDRVIDAQGLIKSALLAGLAGAPVHGLDRASAREPLASRLYQQGWPVPWGAHAIVRNQRLFAQVFGYAHRDAPPNYGLQTLRQTWLETPLAAELGAITQAPFIFGIHATTWDSKHWPELYWQTLAKKLSLQDLTLVLPWGNATEQARALRIQAAHPRSVHVLPQLNLQQMAQVMVRARAFVGVDTGLSHLAAALGVAGLSLYGATDPQRTGVLGEQQQTFASPIACAPCLKRQCPLPLTADGLIPCQARLHPQQVATLLGGLTRR